MIYTEIRGFDDWINHDPRYDEEPICTCECGEGIYEGETAYKINNKIYCERCIHDAEFTVDSDMWKD